MSWFRRTAPLVVVCLLMGGFVGALPAPTQIQAEALQSNFRYVAPEGSDANACDSPAAPCRTISAALARTPVEGTISLAAGTYPETVLITRSVTLVGAGPGLTVLDGRHANRVITIAPGRSVALLSLTIQNGSSPRDGGGIFTQSPLALTDVVLTGNTAAGLGGAIRADAQAPLLIVRTRMHQNTARSGGALASQAGVQLENVWLHQNHASRAGGGIYLQRRMTSRVVARLDKVTLTENRARDGAGLYAEEQTEMRNTTFSENRATHSGGAIVAAAPVRLIHATLADNQAPQGAGIAVEAGSLRVGNSVLANQPTTENCFWAAFHAGSLASDGHNLESGTSCRFTWAGDLINTDPRLGPLWTVGLAAPVRPLLAHSPAIDAGANMSCLATDQRGVARPLSGDRHGPTGCDLGAYEFDPTAPLNAAHLPFLSSSERIVK